MPKVFNTLAQRWEWAQAYQHDGQAWMEVMRGDQDEAAVLTSAFDHDGRGYMGAGTVLQRDLSNMPIHPLSDQMAQWMWDYTPFSAAGGWGSKTSLNTSSFGTQPVHMYVIDSTHPDCKFATFGDKSTAINTPTAEINTYMRGQIPKYEWMVPAQNGDRGMAIYDTGTGIMREWFMCMKQDDGTWGGGGGYSLGTPGLKDLAVTNYGLQQRRGIATVSGMHNSLGFIGIAEALNKEIRHALCFTVGAAATRTNVTTDGYAFGGVSWPSRAADGKAEVYAPRGGKYDPKNPNHLHNGVPPTPTHGQWGRLKTDVDPMHNPRTGKAYKPFTRVLIEAAKKYGLVMTDTNLWVNAFNAEQGRTWAHTYGSDPWASGGVISKVYADPADPSGNGDAGTGCDDFPWDRTEWSLIDWGRPSPDWNLRPGQPVPWWSPADPDNPLNTMPK